MTKSRIQGAESPNPITTKFSMSGAVHNGFHFPAFFALRLTTLVLLVYIPRFACMNN